MALGSYNGYTGHQRDKAQKWLNRQWASGALPRPNICRACGQTEGAIDGHAEDYSAPFGPHIQGFWLCYRCHLMLHCRFQSSRAFGLYAVAVANGWRWEPVYQRNFTGVIVPMLRTDELPGPRERFAPQPDPLLLRDLGMGKYAPHHAGRPDQLTLIQGGS
jgi:hypothetical protein